MSSGKRSSPVIAIDGPAGVGKSTTARLVAKGLGYTLVDTGAIYRSVALMAKERGINFEEGRRVASLAAELDIELSQGPDGSTRVIVNGIERSDDIRRDEISTGASKISKEPTVREALLGLQRELGKEGGVVLEGRDIGTVVFPDAEVKIFLTADPRVRAKRRFDELIERGEEAQLDVVLQDMKRRDQRDETRAVAPLKAATDAVVIDSSGATVEAVVSQVLEVVSRHSS